jgi:excisionase family DNA binding protein
MAALSLFMNSFRKGIAMEQLLTVQKAAKMLGLTTDVLYRLCRQKQFPHLRLGQSKIMIARSVVDNWIADQARQNAAGQAINAA